MDNKPHNIIVRCCDTPCKEKAGNNKCVSCQEYMCDLCYIKSEKRINISIFYKQYIGFCDQCIWWDMG